MVSGTWFFFLVLIAFLIPELQRQNSCLCGSDKAVHFWGTSIWWLRLIDIQQQSTCPPWSKANVCTCWKHPSSNWLETLQLPEWRKMTLTCPCHWHKTNRKAITGHVEHCLSCHGPVSGHWLRNFQERGRSIELLKHFNGHPLLNPLQGAFDRSSHIDMVKSYAAA